MSSSTPTILDFENNNEDFLKLISLITRAKRTVVVTGAGISTASGIPDFRSEDGLYNLVKKRYPTAIVKGKDLFDANLFRDATSTKLFYSFMAELKLLINDAKATPTHSFLKWLDNESKLLRVYTQNIDCLESQLEMNTVTDLKDKSKRIVQLHGDMESVVCTLCKAIFDFTSDHVDTFREGDAPTCEACIESTEKREAQGKRTLRCGTLRPNIVLYNETHSQGDIIGEMAAFDQRRKPDLLVVMGTSLKVDGVKRLVKDMAKTVKSHNNGSVVLINKTELGREWDNVFDYIVLNDTDSTCLKIQSAIVERNIKKELEKENKPKKVSTTTTTKVKKDGKINFKTTKSGGTKRTIEKKLTSASSVVEKKKNDHITIKDVKETIILPDDLSESDIKRGHDFLVRNCV